MNGVLQVRKLDVEDYSALKDMDTGLDDDYVVRIFPELIARENNEVFGLFDENQMIAVGGYTTFYNKYAMLGRLRSDKRFYGQGHATYLLDQIIERVRQNPSIVWIGANTQSNNLPARKVLKKIHMPALATLHPLHIEQPEQIPHPDGPVWEMVQDVSAKRKWIESLTLEVFPYEAYYPLPFDNIYITDDYLSQSAMYINPAGDRIVLIQEDTKKHVYANVKYFWDDLFTQPGLWKTIAYDKQQREAIDAIWMDVSPDVYADLPAAFNSSQDAWLLHGFRVTN
ncbi:GNAT family N-acetyltransferase [Pontibacillus salicampi]|uniref:GNAT family N-acetyltransferase n=1 Tax=Pontibacillus salicampi TaxID=1449801 RepID=A0ABV6LT54_9BACI